MVKIGVLEASLTLICKNLCFSKSDEHQRHFHKKQKNSFYLICLIIVVCVTYNLEKNTD